MAVKFDSLKITPINLENQNDLSSDLSMRKQAVAQSDFFGLSVQSRSKINM